MPSGRGIREDAAAGGTFHEVLRVLRRQQEENRLDLACRWLEATQSRNGLGGGALARLRASRGNNETGDGGPDTEAAAAAARGQHHQSADLCGGDLGLYVAAYEESAPGAKNSRLRPGERSPTKATRVVRALERDMESGRWPSGTTLGHIATHHTQWWGAIARRRRVVPPALPTARRSTVGRCRPGAPVRRRRAGGACTRAGPDSDPSEQSDSSGAAGLGPVLQRAFFPGIGRSWRPPAEGSSLAVRPGGLP